MHNKFTLILNHDFRLEKLLLKSCFLGDLLLGKRLILRAYNPLVLNIVKTVNDRDNLSCKAFDWLVHAENIRVLSLTVGSLDALNIAVVDWIENIPVLGVKAAQRSVDRHGDK